MNLPQNLPGRWTAAAFLATATLALLVTVPARAETGAHGVQTLTATVRYDDLDLTTEAGARTLYQRIVTGARRVCPDDQSRSSKLARAVRQCREAAIDGAISQIGNPQQAAVRAAQSHGSTSG